MRHITLTSIFLLFLFGSYSQTSCYTIKISDPAATDGVYEIDPDNEEFRINVKGLQNGVYLNKVDSTVRRFIKQ